MLIFADLNFTTANVIAGESVDREFVTDCLSALGQKLEAPLELRSRLVVPPTNAIDQWWESRLALCRCADGIAGPFLASISHTNGISVAAIRPSSSEVLGIGIDIERHDRLISERAVKRIQNLVSQSDEPELLRWVRYEAAFKSCYGNPTMRNEGAEIFVAQDCEIRTNLQQYEEFVIGLAVASKFSAE